MTLYISHRHQRLVDFLAERLTAGHSPLSERWVLLPSLVNKQYLMVELVKRISTNAIAAVQFLNWREALHRICCSSLHIPDRLEIELRLAKIFLNEVPADAKEILGPVTAWLEAGRSTRLNTLVRSLSHQILEAGFYGIEMGAPWQRKLYEMLALDGSWSLPEQVLRQAVFPGAVSQLHVFGIDEMPSAGWDFLISKAPDPSIYLFSPCCMYWEDSVSDSERRYLTKRLRAKGISSSSLEVYESYLRDTHPLLANWGRLGRVTLRCLETGSLQAVEAYESDEETRPSLLGAVQEDILFLRTAGESTYERDPNDLSIQIAAAGSSRLRETQILKDNILCFLEKTKAPISDILVLAPDIRLYEPIIRFVFGADLPVSIAPVAVLPQNPYLLAWQLFFNLPDRRWEADAVLELFENAAFQSKHRLTPEDLQWFRIWLKEAKVRGALHARPGGWPEGLKRMVSGLIYLLPDEEPLPRISNIDWGQAERLALFIRLIELLQKHLLALQKKSCTVEEWALLLKNAADELFEADENQDEILRSFIRKLSRLSSNFSGDLFPYSLIRTVFEEDSQSATTTYQAPFIEAVHFASMQMGAIRPARAIFLIGMDSENFPRKEISSTLNWESKKPPDDDLDRYLLLQSLFSAKDLFYISYCHLSSHDGKTIEPGLPVQELIQTIDAYYPLKTPKSMISVHPVLPYDSSYFEKGSPLRSFSMDAFRAASASCGSHKIFWPTEPLKNRETKTQQFDLADLSLAARHPWKYFLQRRLGIYLKEERLFSELRREDLAITPYQEQKLLNLALQHPVGEVLERHAHLLPPGGFGEWAKMQIKKKAAERNVHLQKWGIFPDEIFSLCFSRECQSCGPVAPRRVEAPPIVLTLPDLGLDVEITGEVDLLVKSGLLTAGEPNLFGTLRHWPEWLAARIAFPSCSTIYSLKKGTSKTWEEIDARNALGRWVQYALRAEESLSPLIFPWVDLFLKKNFDEWKDEAQKSLMKEEDLAIGWVLERSQPLPYEHIWKEWNAYIKQTLAELITEKDDAVV